MSENSLNDLQVIKIQNEISLQEIDKKIKEKELKKRIILQPTAVTIIVALLGLIGAVITNSLQKSNQLAIEEKKFQYSIYQSALGAKDNVTAAKILDFYIKAGLLPGEEGKYSKLLEDGKVNEVPIYSGIYKDITVPNIDHSTALTLSDNFIKGNGTEYLLSYNAKRRIDGNKPKTIVLHCSFSNDMKKLASFLSDTLTGRASAHIIIDRDGRVIQQVPFNYISHHAGQYNNSSIGIELINIGELKKTAQGYFNIYGQKVNSNNIICNDKVCWEKYSPAQIKTTLEICKLLVQEYDIQQIVQHSEIDKKKTDPGPFFPINSFKSLIKKN